MLHTSLVPEIWPSPSQYRRPCQTSTPFVHPATERTPAMYYDAYGYCDPSMSATQTITVIEKVGTSWMTWVIIGGVAYLVWKYRKSIF